MKPVSYDVGDLDVEICGKIVKKSPKEYIQLEVDVRRFDFGKGYEFLVQRSIKLEPNQPSDKMEGKLNQFAENVIYDSCNKLFTKMPVKYRDKNSRKEYILNFKKMLEENMTAQTGIPISVRPLIEAFMIDDLMPRE